MTTVERQRLPTAATVRVAATRAGGWLPAGLVVLAAAFLLVTALGPLGNGLWFDEIHSVLSFISPGPSGIWGAYTPNDHMLFELLSWATVNLVGAHSASAYRFWGVVPAIAGVAVMTWWLWRRLGPWAAAVFAVLAVTAPLHMLLTIQARGYGLGFLASVVMVVGADELGRAPTRRAQALFAGGALLGILTLETFVMPFLTLAASLAYFRPGLRRVLAWLVAIVAVVSAAFYGPVISAALSQTGNIAAHPVPLHAVIPLLFGDLLAPSINLVTSHVSLTAGMVDPTDSVSVSEVAAAVVLLAAAVALWRRRERLLIVLTILPAVVTYVLFAVFRFSLASRYTTILLLPLLVPVAFLLADCGVRLAARGFLPGLAAAALALAGSLALLHGGERFYRTGVAVPIENWQAAGAIVAANPQATAVTNTANYPELDYYAHRIVPPLSPPRVAPVLCSNTPVVYVEHIRPHLPTLSPTCLIRRHATEISLKQLFYRLNVWIAPRPLRPVDWCLSRAQLGIAPTAPARLALGSPYPVTLADADQRPVRASVTVLRTAEAASLTTSKGAVLEADGRFVAIIYRLTNLGTRPVAPAALNALFGVTGTSFHLYRPPAVTWLALPDGGVACGDAAATFARLQGVRSPAAMVPPRHTIDSLAVYATDPVAVGGVRDTAPASLAWTSLPLRLRLPLG